MRKRTLTWQEAHHKVAGSRQTFSQMRMLKKT